MDRYYSVILPDRRAGGDACYFIVYERPSDRAIYEGATYEDREACQEAADDVTTQMNQSQS